MLYFSEKDCIIQSPTEKQKPIGCPKFAGDLDWGPREEPML